MTRVPVQDLPTEKVDKLLRVAKLEIAIPPIKAGRESFEFIGERQQDGTVLHVPSFHYRDALVYGGEKRQRVVDSLEEAIGIFYKCNCCVDDDDHDLGPKLWVLSPNAYQHIMCRSDSLRYMDPVRCTLLTVPYQINPRIK